jgi:diguanylate cyclase
MATVPQPISLLGVESGFTPRVRAHIVGALVLLMPLIEIVFVAISPSAKHAPIDLILSIAASAFGLVVWKTAERWPNWAFTVLATVAVGLLGVGVWLKGPGDGVVDMTPEFGMALAVAYLTLSMTAAIIQNIWMAVVLTIATSSVTTSAQYVVSKVGIATCSFTTVGIIAGLLRRRLEHVISNITTIANTDSLTLLTNRSSFMEAATSLLATADEQRSTLAGQLFLIDLDHFKEVNDKLGHHYGDVLIQLAADRLQKLAGPRDLVARLGGDEFAILIPDMVRALGIPEQISAAFSQHFVVEGTDLYVETSVGIAEFPTHGVRIETLMQHADAALYRAKTSSIGHSIYEPTVTYEPTRRLEILGDLRDAIDRNDLILHFQPKLNIESGQIESVEALVRWNHPQRGSLPPAEFLPVAEYSGLIHPLTRHVLREALMQHNRWAAQGIQLDIAVNVSARNLLDRTFPAAVETILREARVAGSHLTVEVTESAILTELDRTGPVLARLRSLGIQISVDDFGTGFSSLSTLCDIEFDEVKLDRSFLQDLTPGSRTLPIVRSIVTMGRELGLRVVAEGIETQVVLDTVTELRCHVAQGYLISRPVPAVEIERILTAADTARAL